MGLSPICLFFVAQGRGRMSGAAGENALSGLAKIKVIKNFFNTIALSHNPPHLLIRRAGGGCAGPNFDTPGPVGIFFRVHRWRTAPVIRPEPWTEYLYSPLYMIHPAPFTEYLYG